MIDTSTTLAVTTKNIGCEFLNYLNDLELETPLVYILDADSDLAEIRTNDKHHKMVPLLKLLIQTFAGGYIANNHQRFTVFLN